MKSQKEENEEHGKECAALIVRMKDGDKNAEGELFIICKSRLYRYAWKLYGNKEEARDACGDSWEKGRDEIINKNYKEDNSFTGLICKFIKNDFLKLKRKKIFFVKLDSIEEIANTEREECYSKGMKVLVMKLLSTYTPRMQDIMTMICIQGVPYNIVGRKHNISAASLRGEVSLVKKGFRAKLGLYDGDVLVEMDSE